MYLRFRAFHTVNLSLHVQRLYFAVTFRSLPIFLKCFVRDYFDFIDLKSEKTLTSLRFLIKFKQVSISEMFISIIQIVWEKF
jgi:hypothetical protein